MKKLILLIFLCLLLPAKDIFGQSITDGTRFLYYQELMGPPFIVPYIVDVKIISSVAGMVYFSSDGNDTPDWVKIGDKIYRLYNNIPLSVEYDYSLQTGDTFTYLDTFPYFSGRTEMYVVDSVKSLRLKDSNTYKHWYLRNIENDWPFKPKAIWVEGLGEKTMGWGWFYAGIIDGPAYLKAVCSKNHDLILWNNYIPDFDRSCNFDSLAKLISIPEPSSRQIVLYPNPSTDYIRFETESATPFTLFNAYGQQVMSGSSDGYLSVAHLPQGFYILHLHTNGDFFVSKFLKQ